jgi:hypothetical protein
LSVRVRLDELAFEDDLAKLGLELANQTAGDIQTIFTLRSTTWTFAALLVSLCSLVFHDTAMSVELLAFHAQLLEAGLNCCELCSDTV